MLSIAISGDQWPDYVRLSDIEDRFVCECGKRGADIRPDFPAAMDGLLAFRHSQATSVPRGIHVGVRATYSRKRIIPIAG
jgi:hypothetical protein